MNPSLEVSSLHHPISSLASPPPTFSTTARVSSLFSLFTLSTCSCTLTLTAHLPARPFTRQQLTPSLMRRCKTRTRRSTSSLVSWSEATSPPLLGEGAPVHSLLSTCPDHHVSCPSSLFSLAHRHTHHCDHYVSNSCSHLSR